MLTVYMAEIPAFIEEEDIELQYCIYNESEMIFKKSVLMNYKKPVLVGQVTMQRLVQELKPYKGEEILVLIHDTPLYESVRGTLKTKHKDVLLLARKTNKAIKDFGNITVKNVSFNPNDLRVWGEVIKENFKQLAF